MDRRVSLRQAFLLLFGIALIADGLRLKAERRTVHDIILSLVSRHNNLALSCSCTTSTSAKQVLVLLSLKVRKDCTTGSITSSPIRC
jgi:hypothetical protein